MSATKLLRRPLAIISVAVLAVFIAAACGGGGGPSDFDPPPTATSDGVPRDSAGLRDGLAEFDTSVAVWNAYWYSRYNLGSLAMMSGLGVTFAPPMEAVQMMVQMVDQGPAGGEHVMVPGNPAMLQAVYAGGDPRFVNAFNGDPMDLTNWRWDPALMDTRLLPSAQAQTIIKETEWAKFFNAGTWAGGVTDDFGAMDRFKGVVLFAEAKMQASFALQQLRNDDGLFIASSRFEDGEVVPVDSSVNLSDQYQMLQALADVRMVLDSPEQYNGVYADDSARDMFAAATDEFFTSVAGLEPAGVAELSLGIQAFTWFAAGTGDADLRSQALDQIRSFGDALVAAPRSGVVERAQAIRGLVESGRVLDEAAHLAAAAADFQALSDAYDVPTGSFAGVSSLSNWQVGDILGALNALRLNAGTNVAREDVEAILTGFFEAVINRSGFMQAAIPKEMEASSFELERVGSDLLFAYPGIPGPREAGGPNGTAAVDAAEVRFDSELGRWEVSDRLYHTAGAMHTSNEMFWTFGFVSGFPQVSEANAAAE